MIEAEDRETNAVLPLSKPKAELSTSLMRIGILSEEAMASRYVRDLIEWSKTRSDLCVTHFIHAQPASGAFATQQGLSGKRGLVARAEALYTAMSAALFKMVEEIEAIRLRHSLRHFNHESMAPLRDWAPQTLSVTAQFDSDGAGYRVLDSAVEHVKALKLDLIIRVGAAMPRGSVLTSARLGVISLQLFDDRVARGSPAGFWEVYLRHRATGFSIQKDGNEIPGARLLVRGRFPTRHYYLLNRAAVSEKAFHYLQQLLVHIASAGQLPPATPAVPYSRRRLSPPRAHETVDYFLRFLTGAIAKKVRRALGQEYYWNVAVVPGNWPHAVLSDGVSIPNPPGRYLADPFVISHEGKDCCFVEDYDIASARGCISAYVLSENGAEPAGVVLDEPFHLSFPYLFHHDGALYMCPESSANRDIRIYRCIDFPTRWELEKIIMSDIIAADTMVFPRSGRWWMLTNVDPIGSGDLCSQLSIFSSDSLLSDKWEPHPLNPVLVDSLQARNAGLLSFEGSLFRVAQQQGFDRYGEAFRINEIVTLNEDDYEERVVAQVQPGFRPDVLGTHHMHSNGSWTVFDYLTQH